MAVQQLSWQVHHLAPTRTRSSSIVRRLPPALTQWLISHLLPFACYKHARGHTQEWNWQLAWRRRGSGKLAAQVH
jgi:hypothetical protein